MGQFRVAVSVVLMAFGSGCNPQPAHRSSALTNGSTTGGDHPGPPVGLMCKDHPGALTAGAETPTTPPTPYCVWFCEGGRVDCNGDLQSDSGDGCETDGTTTKNCGACGNGCSPGVPCSPNNNYCDKPGTECGADSTYFCGTPLSCADNTCCPEKGDKSYKCPEVACCAGDACINGVCSACVPKGGTCGADGDCCGGHACAKGVCQACYPNGNSCSASSQCCGGSCDNGVCACHQGSSCSTGLAGACAAGAWQCDSLTCKQTVFAQPDNNCNGKDDDCDGKIDNSYHPQACTYTESGCQSGFGVPSTSTCVNGHETTCPQPAGFCKQCDNYTDGPCGQCGITACMPGTTKCTPGYACQDGATGMPATCLPVPNCGPLKCWTSSQLQVNGCP